MEPTLFVPEWKRMRDKLIEQSKFFKATDPADASGRRPFDTIQRCIAELDNLIAHYIKSAA